MPSRNIAVRSDIYSALRKEMRPKESFSKVLLRLLHERGPLEEMWGAWGKGSHAEDLRHWKSIRAPPSRGGRR
jgi:predicted CopG family antitoxin